MQARDSWIVDLDSPSSETRFASVIDAVGSDDFAETFMRYSAEVFGAESCSLSELVQGKPRTIGLASVNGNRYAHDGYRPYEQRQHWKIDPGIMIANSHSRDSRPILLHMPREELEPQFVTEVYGAKVADRLLFSGYVQNRPILLGLFRPPSWGQFRSTDVARLANTGGSLLSAIAKHIQMCDRMRDLVRSFTEKEAIEANIRHTGEPLSKREIEVCARILAGLSCEGIALDLQVGVETVTTYRKRAYARLGIATRYELFLWYVQAGAGLPTPAGPMTMLTGPRC